MLEPLPVALPARRDDWPESWLASHAVDQLELSRDARTCADPGYVRAYRQRVALALDLVESVAAPGADVLDVAGAQGNLTAALAMRGYAVTWNDLRADLEGYVRMKLSGAIVRFRPGNVFDVDTGPHDLVLAAEVIEHVAHPDALLARLGGLVRPGGHVVLTTPNGAFLRNTLPRFTDFADPSVFEADEFRPDADGHIFLLHADELGLLAASAGLEHVLTRCCTSVLARGWMRTAMLSRRLPERLIAGLDRAVVGGPTFVRERLATHLGAVFRRPA